MKTTSGAFLIEANIPFKNLGGGVFRQILGYDGNIMMVKFKFEKGGIGALHSHYHSQTAMVVSGIFELTINGESRILKPGDGYYVEPNVVHGAVCIEEGVLLDAFSPVREDFLE